MNFLYQNTVKQSSITSLVIAGWTGRDKTARELHMLELEKLGIARPEKTPTYYTVSKELLTHNTKIDVVGEDTSGEVEIFVMSMIDGLYLGVGSDHTDRKLEAQNITLSKQQCPKPISREIWRLDEVVDHYDQLILRCYVREDGKLNLYQEFELSNCLTPSEILRHGNLSEEDVGRVVFCGTGVVIGSLRHSSFYQLELVDPVRGKSISHNYEVYCI